MSSAEQKIVMKHLRGVLAEAFGRGDFLAARNVEALLSSIESMDAQEYAECSSEMDPSLTDQGVR